MMRRRLNEVHGVNEKIMNKTEQRQSCRLDWAQSSWTRWLHVIFWWWIHPILSLGHKRDLVDDDLDELSPNDASSVLLNKLDCDNVQWTTTWRMIAGAFWKESLAVGLLLLPYMAVRIAQPLILREIVLYIANRSTLPAYVGYLSAIGLAACSALQAIINQQFFFRTVCVGIRIRNTLSSTIYKRLLSINTASLRETTAAQIINLIANDASKFEELCIFMHFLWEAPLEALIMFGLIWRNIGIPTLFGYTVLVLLVPVQLIFSRQFSQCRKMTMVCTDKRIQTINELVNGCQIVKMYNWEKAMEQRVLETRQHELSSILRASRLRAFNMGIYFISLPLISLATFGGSWLMGRQLLTADIFSTLAFFGMARLTVTNFLPSAIEKLSDVRIASNRIDVFMRFKTMSTKREKEEGTAIVMRDACFSWGNSSCLSGLTMHIEPGTLIGVIGAVGAGKSSLLAAILGEMSLISGQLKVRANSISYASQMTWIFSDTIRANILLGKPLDELRYTSVIKACCLDTDLSTFGQAGDLTMIGEKGINLSGGQKARVSLARALYIDADIYLLDDPLAAVDPLVAKRLFDQCIGPHSLLRTKTRLLVTHQTHFLVGSHQIFLLKNGHIEAQGTLDQVSIDRQSVDAQSNSTKKTTPLEPTEVDWTHKSAVVDEQTIVTRETSTVGGVNWGLWRRMFTSPPLGWCGLFFLVLFMCAGEALYDTTNSWLGLWSDKSYDQQRSPSQAYIYLGLTLGTLILALIRADYFIYIMLQGSTCLHNRMLNGLLYTSLRFFESNPSGRILNRASKDQQVIDELLPTTLLDCLQALLMTLGALVIIGRVNPWVLLVLVPLVPTVWWLRRFYLHPGRQLKRLESVTRSPVYAFFSSSLDGLSTIRAFNVKDDFIRMFLERVDTNTRAYFILMAAVRWFCLRLDLMTSLVSLVTAILSVALSHQISPSAAALGLTYCINLTGLFQWGVRQSAEAENLMTSAERIDEYSWLAPEEDKHSSGGKLFIEPPDNWPSRGTIEFKNYTMRYRSELEPVLKNIDLSIKPGEKIGIIGRTGKYRYSSINIDL